MIRISKITLNGTEEECKSINLIIGPNNSGKSTLLNELSSTSTSLQTQPTYKWLESIVLEAPHFRESLRKMFPGLNFESPPPNESLKEDSLDSTGFSAFRPDFAQNPQTFLVQNVFNDYMNTSDDKDSVQLVIDSSDQNSINGKAYYYLFRLLVRVEIAIEMSGNRLSPQLNANIQQILNQRRETLIHHLLLDSEMLVEIQKNIKRTFGLSVGFDNLQQGIKALRILPKEKISGAGNLKDTAKEWRDKSPLLQEQGDGIRGYLKLIFSLLDPHNQVVFIDEPEAFLHPPQRRELGSLIAKLAKERNKQVFIATHDSEFLRGVLSSGNDTKVLYLSDKDGNKEYTDVELSEFDKLTKKQPELLNERILNSFFYRTTIIAESESDRVFYEYVASLYLWSEVQGVNFVGMNGKGNAIKLFENMTKLGLDARVILDIDFLTDEKMPVSLNDAILKTMHSKFKQDFRNAQLNRDELKSKGIAYIQISHPTLATDLSNLIARYVTHGIFVLENGELESWTSCSKNDLECMLSYAREKTRRKLKAFLKTAII